MKTLIFEGIATSGKTTVEQKLVKLLADKGISYALVDEHKTLMPILDNKDLQTSIQLLNKILDEVYQTKTQVVIFDRLYFTHIIRTNSALKDFKEIENKLIQHNPEIIFLKIDEQKIAERVKWAMDNRDKKWLEYVKKKGTNKEIFQYYKTQQQKIEELSKQTAILVSVYDTDNLDFDKISQKILQNLDL